MTAWCFCLRLGKWRGFGPEVGNCSMVFSAVRALDACCTILNLYRPGRPSIVKAFMLCRVRHPFFAAEVPAVADLGVPGDRKAFACLPKSLCDLGTCLSETHMWQVQNHCTSIKQSLFSGFAMVHSVVRRVSRLHDCRQREALQGTDHCRGQKDRGLQAEQSAAGPLMWQLQVSLQ